MRHAPSPTVSSGASPMMVVSRHQPIERRPQRWDGTLARGISSRDAPPLPQTELTALVRRALEEDVGSGDVTTEATVAADARARATIAQKAPGVIYGLDAAEAAFALLDPAARCERLVEEGVWREEGGPVLAWRAPRARCSPRSAPRSTSSLTSPASPRWPRARRARWREPGRGCSTRARPPRGCARWRRPRWRRAGRTTIARGSYDAILIKENHIAAAGGIAQAVARARAAAPGWRRRSRWRCATPRRSSRRSPRAPRACCWTTWTTPQLRAAVAQVAGRAQLEASGGVTLQTLRERAETGVEWISMGALTHSAPALDLSLTLEALP